jgi:hypothetical protein
MTTATSILAAFRRDRSWLSVVVLALMFSVLRLLADKAANTNSLLQTRNYVTGNTSVPLQRVGSAVTLLFRIWVLTGPNIYPD